MDAEQMASQLVEEFSYSISGAQRAAQKLLTLSSPVAEAFMTWWRSREVPEIEVEGYTVASLMQRQGMNPIAAFLTLDWLFREPERARASLRRGHDRVALPRGRPRPRVAQRA